MKEIFMPSMDELYLMQDKGANVYKYILIKAIEALICEGLNYPNAGMLKSAYSYLKEDKEIVRAVCTLYPDEMEYAKIASSDPILCGRLMNWKEYTPSGLDNLCRFSSDVVLDRERLAKIIVLLERELSQNPRYRFEYVGYDLAYHKRNTVPILDNIINRKISDSEIMFMMGSLRNDVVNALIKIEPAYALSLSDCYFRDNIGLSEEQARVNALYTGINNYAERYGISRYVGAEYQGKDILTNPDQNVKRLIRCIEDRR